MCLASWPIATAQNVHAASATSTDSGSVAPEMGTAMPIENARPTPGAMYVIA